MALSLRRIAAAAVVAVTPILSIGFASAAAVTHTWTGAGANVNWSTAANWSDNLAPVSGDSVVIDNAKTAAFGITRDDIVGLSLVSISFINNNPANPNGSLYTNQDLTVTSAITQAPSVTSNTNFINSETASHIITLGGDVIVTSNSGFSFGTNIAGDQIALAGHKLSFVDYANSTTDIVAVSSAITGSGTVVYNGGSTDYQLEGVNTYSGATNILKSYLPVSNSGLSKNPNNLFGTSTVTVASAGSVDFTTDANVTINNPIIVSGQLTNNTVTSLGFRITTDGLKFTVPNITLNGNTRFSGSLMTSGNVDLAGTKANGFCVEYLGRGGLYSVTDGPANGFLNGPAGCIVKSTTTATAVTVPKTPNTGFRLVTSNPIQTLVIGLVATTAIAGAAFKLRTASARR